MRVFDPSTPYDYPDGWREALKKKWPDGERLTLAFRLATSLEVLESLLLGYYVDPIRLDQEWLRWAKREKYVALKPAIEVLAHQGVLNA